jgi:hypothetical protein
MYACALAQQQGCTAQLQEQCLACAAARLMPLAGPHLGAPAEALDHGTRDIQRAVQRDHTMQQVAERLQPKVTWVER